MHFLGIHIITTYTVVGCVLPVNIVCLMKNIAKCGDDKSDLLLQISESVTLLLVLFLAI